MGLKIQPIGTERVNLFVWNNKRKPWFVLKRSFTVSRCAVNHPPPWSDYSVYTEQQYCSAFIRIQYLGNRCLTIFLWRHGLFAAYNLAGFGVRRKSIQFFNAFLDNRSGQNNWTLNVSWALGKQLDCVTSFCSCFRKCSTVSSLYFFYNKGKELPVFDDEFSTWPPHVKHCFCCQRLRSVISRTISESPGGSEWMS